MTSQNIRKYLELEADMLLLDDTNPEAADKVRDEMDVIWYRLTQEEKSYLQSYSPLRQ